MAARESADPKTDYRPGYGRIMDDGLTVVDLFCGGGGFSEGFRQAGFDISFAVDVDSGACETYRTNRRTEDEVVVEADILDVKLEDFPDDVDILIGSPPCTEFSMAKNGGGGDIEKGMELVYRFLYFVVELDPDYWIMENVPRLDEHLPKEVDYSDIPWLDDSSDKKLEIPKKRRIDCEEFGTPQRRTRLFSGDFPSPDEFAKPGLTLEEVQNSLPEPRYEQSELGSITDPLYESHELPAEELTDHFYNSYLTEREAKEIRVRKEDHSYYGPMSFPDERDNQSRTVLAMNRRIARETLVLEGSNPPEGYSEFRKPTIREIATIQGFPISYQFQGNSLSQKWRRVGDAVPPTVSYRLALAIRQDLGKLDDDIVPDLNSEVPNVDTNLNNRDLSSKGRRRLSISRSFRHHVPYDDMREFRVDLETTDQRPEHPLSRVIRPKADSDRSEASPPLANMLDDDLNLYHPVEFQVVLYRGYAKEVESTPVGLDESLGYLDNLIDQRPNLENRVKAFLSDLNEVLGPKVPDATTLQAIRSRRHERDEPREFEILEAIAQHQGSTKRGIVDTSFPREEFMPPEGHNLKLDETGSTNLAEFGAQDGGRERPLPVDGLLDGTYLPIRVLMKLVAANYVAHKLNHCAKWMKQNPEEMFVPDELDELAEYTSSKPSCMSKECIEERIERFVADFNTVDENRGYAD